MNQLPFKIYFEDANILVLSKPWGLLSQSDISGEESLVDILRKYFGRQYVGLVHRLDRNTSGLMVVAKRTKPANRLTDALQSNQLKRAYKAWVVGKIAEVGETFRWEDFLIKDEKTNVVKVCQPNLGGAKEAVLSGRVLETVKDSKGQNYSLIELVLDTGRSHQIRVQASHRGHVLVGDTKYGYLNQGRLKVERPLLHSCYLEFNYPVGEAKPMVFREEIPEDMISLTRELKPTR